ncbi:MAG: FHA domain-containing protein [Gammaproteobacteria bacterium]
MAKLVLSVNGAVQGEYELNKERMTIGRKPDNDVQIDNLAVSSKHALVITILDDSFLEDLGSTNGTYVNGKLIKKHALKDGDVIGIGKHEVRYVNEHATADDDEFEKTIVMRPGSASAAAAIAQAVRHAVPAAPSAPLPGALTQSTPARAPAPAAGLPNGRLHILTGPISGKLLDLTRASTTLGRPGIQVAVISRRPQGFFLTHIEGGNSGHPLYPIVNGTAIGPRSYQLRDHDIIELAGIKMQFQAT